MKGIVTKKPVSKKPSSFTIKSKSPRAYKNEERKSQEIKKNLEHYTNDWLEGRISDKDYKALKNDLYKQQERLINSNYIKTYSVTMTEGEFKLFSEFLEQKEYTGKVKLQNKNIKREYFLHYSPYVFNGKRSRPNKDYKNFKRVKSWYKDNPDSSAVRYYKERVDTFLNRSRKRYAERNSSGDLALPLELKRAYGAKGTAASIKSDINYRINTKAEALKDGMTLNDYISSNFGKKGTKGVVKRLSKSKTEK